MQPREAVIICDYIYHYNYPHHYYNGRHNYLLKEIGWEFLSASGDKDDVNGYFGAAFIKGTETAIAHRGTNIELTKYQEIITSFIGAFKDIDDDIAIALNLVPTQYYNAKTFTDMALTTTTARVITHVGHSLGGALAQLLSIQYKHAAIVFDSPGVLGVAKQLFSLEAIYVNNIVSYVSGPNIVNTVGSHIVMPTFLHFNTPIINHLNFFTYIKFSLDQHSVLKILEQFSPVTGGPTSVSYPESWPGGFREGFQAFIRIIVDKADKVFFIQGNCKEEIASLYGINIERIKTLDEYSGFGPLNFPAFDNEFIGEYINMEFVIEPQSQLPLLNNGIEDVFNMFGNVMGFSNPDELKDFAQTLEGIRELAIEYLAQEDSGGN